MNNSVSVLRAMSCNYANGHSWDHLDSKACDKAADEIERLRAEVEAVTTEKNELANLISKGLDSELVMSERRLRYEVIEQLAASQAREKVLREALEDYFRQYPHMMKGYILDALSQPTEDIALREFVADEMVKMVDNLSAYGGTSFVVKDYAERYRKGDV